MSDELEKTYEVGYKKPPVATRYKKGKSGNPTGRPPKKTTDPEADVGKALQTIDNEEIVVTIDAKRMRMRKAEVHFRLLFSSANKGDLKAARIIARMAKQYFGPEAEGTSEPVFIVRNPAFNQPDNQN